MAEPLTEAEVLAIAEAEAQAWEKRQKKQGGEPATEDTAIVDWLTDNVSLWKPYKGKYADELWQKLSDDVRNQYRQYYNRELDKQRQMVEQQAGGVPQTLPEFNLPDVIKDNKGNFINVQAWQIYDVLQTTDLSGNPAEVNLYAPVLSPDQINAQGAASALQNLFYGQEGAYQKITPADLQALVKDNPQYRLENFFPQMVYKSLAQNVAKQYGMTQEQVQNNPGLQQYLRNTTEIYVNQGKLDLPKVSGDIQRGMAKTVPSLLELANLGFTKQNLGADYGRLEKEISPLLAEWRNEWGTKSLTQGRENQLRQQLFDTLSTYDLGGAVNYVQATTPLPPLGEPLDYGEVYNLIGDLGEKMLQGQTARASEAPTRLGIQRFLASSPEAPAQLQEKLAQAQEAARKAMEADTSGAWPQGIYNKAFMKSLSELPGISVMPEDEATIQRSNAAWDVLSKAQAQARASWMVPGQKWEETAPEVWPAWERLRDAYALMMSQGQSATEPRPYLSPQERQQEVADAAKAYQSALTKWQTQNQTQQKQKATAQAAQARGTAQVQAAQATAEEEKKWRDLVKSMGLPQRKVVY